MALPLPSASVIVDKRDTLMGLAEVLPVLSSARPQHDTEASARRAQLWLAPSAS
jgi:hypothetical protein